MGRDHPLVDIKTDPRDSKPLVSLRFIIILMIVLVGLKTINFTIPLTPEYYNYIIEYVNTQYCTLQSGYTGMLFKVTNIGNRTMREVSASITVQDLSIDGRYLDGESSKGLQKQPNPCNHDYLTSLKPSETAYLWFALPRNAYMSGIEARGKAEIWMSTGGGGCLGQLRTVDFYIPRMEFK
jgi:hypothetical protein